MRPPRMLPSFDTMLILQNQDFTNPPLPGLDVQAVCQRPLEISLTRTDFTRLSINHASWDHSFVANFTNQHLVPLLGGTIHVVGAAGGAPATLRVDSVEDLFVEMDSPDASWSNFWMDNGFRIGDKVAIWAFTTNNHPGLWFAVMVTGRRRFRSVMLL